MAGSVRTQVAVNGTVPAVDPGQAQRIVRSSGASLPKAELPKAGLLGGGFGIAAFVSEARVGGRGLWGGDTGSAGLTASG